MANTNDGGPAFPLVYTDRSTLDPEQHIYGGMSMRDYFAAKAMAAIIGSPRTAHDVDIAEITADAYDVADAMLAERAK